MVLQKIFFKKKGRLIFIMDDKTKKIADLTRSLLVEIGEDPNRDGLLKTPLRSSKAWQFFSEGYRLDINKVINNAIFNEDC